MKKQQEQIDLTEFDNSDGLAYRCVICNEMVLRLIPEEETICHTCQDIIDETLYEFELLDVDKNENS